MSALDRLRQHAGIPDAYSWASVAVSVPEAREIVEHVGQLCVRIDRAEATIADLRAQLAAATPRRCADCGRGARELKALGDGEGGTVMLGPSCYQRRVTTGARSQARLPLGGAR